MVLRIKRTLATLFLVLTAFAASHARGDGLVRQVILIADCGYIGLGTDAVLVEYVTKLIQEGVYLTYIGPSDRCLDAFKKAVHPEKADRFKSLQPQSAPFIADGVAHEVLAAIRDGRRPLVTYFGHGGSTCSLGEDGASHGYCPYAGVYGSYVMQLGQRPGDLGFIEFVAHILKKLKTSVPNEASGKPADPATIEMAMVTCDSGLAHMDLREGMRFGSRSNGNRLHLLTAGTEDADPRDGLGILRKLFGLISSQTPLSPESIQLEFGKSSPNSLYEYGVYSFP
jgi:hypothetical protein